MPPSIQWDVKLSVFWKNKTGKVHYEMYAALDNIQHLFYTSKDDSAFGPYTGKIAMSDLSTSNDIPVTMPSFGLKVSF